MTMLSLRHSASINGRRIAPSLIHVCLVLSGRFMYAAAPFTPRRLNTKRCARPDIRGAHQYALARIRRDLPPTLHYHALRHALDDVLPAVERLATLRYATELDTRG